MLKIKILVIAVFVLFFAVTNFAQVETKVKEAKSTAEKQVQKVSEKLDDASSIASEKNDSCMNKAEESCCGGKMKDAKMSKMNHPSDCTCEMCKNKSEMKSNMKKMTEAHSATCTCDKCKMAHVDMKTNHKAHAENCSCDTCKKS
jgi:hypothetical protein